MLKKILLCIFFYLSLPLLQGAPLEKFIAERAHLSDSSFQAELQLHEHIEPQYWLDSAYFLSLEQQLQAAQRPFGPLFLPFCEQLMAKQDQFLASMEEAAYQDWLAMAEFARAREGRHFEIAADMLFSLLTEALQRGIDEEQLDPHEASVQKVIQALKERQYGVSIPVSDVDKGLHHLEQGNWSYLLNRVSTDYPIPFYGGLVVLGFALFFVINRFRKKRISSKK